MPRDTDLPMPKGRPMRSAGGEMESPQRARSKPATQIRIGSIKATIWRNESEAGVRYGTTFGRLYRDGDQWRMTDSFGRDDLLVLAKLADQAHTWIVAQGQEASVGGNYRGGEERGGR